MSAITEALNWATAKMRISADFFPGALFKTYYDYRLRLLKLPSSRLTQLTIALTSERETTCVFYSPLGVRICSFIINS